MNILSFIKERRKYVFSFILIFTFLNIYLSCINSFSSKTGDLIYLDLILILIQGIFMLLDYLRWKRSLKILMQSKDNNRFFVEDLEQKDIIYREIIENEKKNFSREVEQYETKLNELEEYITKWVHEIKIPISALKILLSRIENIEDSEKGKTELEKMIFLVNSVIYGSRTTSAKEDIFIKNESLKSIVNKSIKNNAFFLIKNNIEIKQKNLDFFIYTDEKWICYVLEQIINNSIKYSSNNAFIEFSGEETEKYIMLNIRDNGIGIAKEDLERIFNKGFTGANGRNTVYKSTGMGLYFVKKIIDKLEHKIEVSSTRGEGTEFKIYFYKISDYLKVTEM